MKIKHTQKFECDECGEVLESKMDMRKHKAAKHAPEQVKKSFKFFYYNWKTCAWTGEETFIILGEVRIG